MGEVMMTVLMIVGGLIIAAVPVIKMIGWAIDGQMEPSWLALAVFLYIALIASIMSAPNALKGVIIVVLVISAVLMPMMGQANDARQIKGMEDSKLLAYAAALEKNPMDAPARMALAEAMYKRGDLEQAIAHMDWTLRQYPTLSPRIKPQLDMWKREMERTGTAPTIICHMCHVENMPGATQCESCGAKFGTIAGVKERVASEGGPMRVIRGWIVIACYTLLIVFIGSFAMKHVEFIYLAPIILAATIVVAWLFLRWVGGDMGSVTD
jgi:hypothetical protein